jgi:adenylate kinase
MMPFVVMITGIPGVGKSTITRLALKKRQKQNIGGKVKGSR